MKTNTKRQLVAHGDYPQYCQMPEKNSHDISTDVWNSSRYIRRCMHLFHVSCGTPTDVLRNPGWETTVYNSASQRF